ncbi:BTB/POZ domain-containing protein 6-like [Saccostrea echinata]|uniref:BTB/POZ domain-containing protein 6-like n=1 Tax=Saccostrea echinata TaxID=191078 RepID=UPI002A82FE0D|nr:BTB/POZ domain-containing protein 6-like [Saccostrea echinata]
MDLVSIGDWQSDLSIPESNKYMLHNKIGCDITFLLGKSKEEVHAHRYMLASRSSVFFAMLYGPFDKSDKAIEIPDIEKDIFEQILRFMYCEEILITEDNVTHILYAARKYGISKVTVECRNFLEKNISPENVCVIAENAHIFDEDELFKMCLDYITKHAFESLQSEAFTQLCRQCVTRIIGRDDLPVDEDHILECMSNWAKRECSRQGLADTEENQRVVLGDLFYLIRFPIMDLTFFADNVAKTCNLLSEKEKIDLYTYMAGSKKELSDTKFVTNQRKPFFITCSRLGAVEKANSENFRWRTGEVEKLDFRVSKKIEIHGIEVYGGRQEKSNYKLSAWLRKHDTDEVIADFHTKLSTTPDRTSYQVFFRKPATAQANKRYCIHLQMKGAKTYWSEEGVTNVTCHDIVFSFLDSQEMGNGTGVKRGQIPGIIFTRYPTNQEG